MLRSTLVSLPHVGLRGDPGTTTAQGNRGAGKALLYLYLTLSISRLESGSANAQGHFALFEEIIVKHAELKQALRLLTKALTNPRIGPDQGQRLQRAKRELEAVARSGKLDRDRIFRAVENIAEVLLEIV